MALRLDSEPTAKKKRRNRPPQTSYLSDHVQKKLAEVEKLAGEVQSLETVNDQLKAEHEWCQVGLEIADNCFWYQVQSRVHLSYYAQQVLRTEKRYQCCLDALPPHKQWGPAVHARIEIMSRDELRFCMFKLYEDSRFLTSATKSSPDPMPRLTSLMSKAVEFFAYFCLNRPDVWSTIMMCDLTTGERTAAPDGWYSKVVASVPKSFLSASIGAQLRKAMQIFGEVMKDVAEYRARLQSRISQLMVEQEQPEVVTGSAAAETAAPSTELADAMASSPADSNQSAEDSRPLRSRQPEPEIWTMAKEGTRLRKLLMKELHQQQLDSDTELSPLDSALALLEKSYKHELRMRVQVARYVMTVTPPYIFAYISGACLPYYLDMRCVLTALLQRMTDESSSLAP